MNFFKRVQRCFGKAKLHEKLKNATNLNLVQPKYFIMELKRRIFPNANLTKFVGIHSRYCVVPNITVVCYNTVVFLQASTTFTVKFCSPSPLILFDILPIM